MVQYYPKWYKWCGLFLNYKSGHSNTNEMYMIETMLIPNDGGLEAKCSEPNVLDSEKASIAMRPRGSHATPY